MLREPASTHDDPLYLQIEDTLQEMIDGAEYKTGDRIPSERTLADQLGVSRMSVRRAVENMIARGVLERRSTSGTYVRVPQIVRPAGSFNVFSLSQCLQEKGMKSGSRIIELGLIRAPRRAAARLQIRVGAHAWRIQRLRLANSQPFCIETSYIPADTVPDLDTDALHAGISLYRLLQEQYNLSASTSQDEWEIASATREESDFLQLPPESPILLMRSLIYDQHEQPLEFLKSINHPDRVTFRSNRSIRTFN